MRWGDKLLLRLRSLFRWPEVEEELDNELRFHIEQQIEENLAAGMPPDEARSAALRDFGGVEQVKEICRERRGLQASDVLPGVIRNPRTPRFTSFFIETSG